MSRRIPTRKLSEVKAAESTANRDLCRFGAYEIREKLFLPDFDIPDGFKLDKTRE